VVAHLFQPTGRPTDDYKLSVLKQAARAPPARGGRNNSAAAGLGAKRWALTLALWCMNPAVTFSATVAVARTIVLTSGTLSPVPAYGRRQMGGVGYLRGTHYRAC
jgi:Rad3-related DNA helicase